jgi:hypothetical protein
VEGLEVREDVFGEVIVSEPMDPQLAVLQAILDELVKLNAEISEVKERFPRMPTLGGLFGKGK